MLKKHPRQVDNDHWVFLCYPGDYYATEHLGYYLPEELFRQMPPESFNGGNACVFGSRDEATAALARAVGKLVALELAV